MKSLFFNIKRCFDILFSFLILLIFSPFSIFFIIPLFFSNDGKIFFFQKRPGLHGKIFRIVKFKTMNDKKDANGKLLPDDQRLTRTGKMIRKLSIDEIPQLINVIKGEMSLIGPRPLLPEYLPLYNKEQSRRHDVKPGITGWAQVNGRNALSWEEKFKLDVWYVDHVSLRLDFKILLLTIRNVIKREGISGGGVETMTKFTGNK
ncbi:sugar transferase [Saccharicrinis sp. FJH54]|uniref:sugar transferase n=1 Tax=Saccharicrinis sp. FJH54 TaxID=3344665 RepID=UPI0035D4F47A